MIGTALAIGVVNATMEELLWRVVFISYWPDSWSPLSVHRLRTVAPRPAGHPYRRESDRLRRRLDGHRPVLGLGGGQTGTLRATTVSHVFTDGSGPRNALFFLPA
jgi:hypothetical protein